MNELLPTIKTSLNEDEAVYSLREAWKELFNEYPKDETLGILYAQTALETARWKSLLNYNFGNIKKTESHDYCSYKCSEIINGKEEFFEPLHPQTFFNSYPTALDGAKEYLLFLSKRTRYAWAWQELINGDPVKYCVALKKGGYFTADLTKYTKGVVSLTEEFNRKKEKLYAWKPPVIEVAPIIIENPVIIDPIAISEPIIPESTLTPEVFNLNWIQTIWQIISQIFKIK